MSVFDLPRLHFAGTAVTRLPTGPRSGLLDLATNRPIAGPAPFPVHRPAEEYHAYLDRRGVKGWNFGGNGHFWVDATVVATETEPGRADTTDPVVGRAVDLWGHYNEYLATTANRARVFDVDPASNWTTTVMVGQLALGRLGRSHDVGYLAIGDVRDVSPPRWQNPRYVLETGDHPLSRELTRSVVHQFVVDADDRLRWTAAAAGSPAVSALRDAVEGGGYGGVLVRFALFNMATPARDSAPDRWQLRGTVAPWRPPEPRTCPTGRLLTAREGRRAGRRSPLHNLTVRLADGRATADMVTALPVVSRAPVPDPRTPGGALHLLGPRLDLGDLELRTASGRLLAVFPRDAYLGAAYERTGGVLTAPRADGRADDPDEALRLAARDGTVLLAEEEITVLTDRASLFLEHPNPRTGDDHAVDITVRSFVRGRPAAVDGIEVHQFCNPRALPLDPRATAPGARAAAIRVVGFGRAARPGGPPEELSATAVLATDVSGHGRLTVGGVRAGAAHILLLPPGTPLPCDPDAPGSAAAGYDNDDRLGYWSAAGLLSARVLPDHWYLADVPPEQVTFDLVHQEVLAYFELMYPFMKAEVMSLADPAKVATHARIIWLMCDPRHKDKTFYMPSTRDLTAPQADLLLTYARRVEGARQTPPPPPAAPPRPAPLTTRDALCAALRQAATIELAVMLQYLYAVWSIPTHSAARQYVERGTWTPEQARLLCGDGPHALDGGLRGSLLGVAREEMTHFLVINNILMATGEPFHLPDIDFTTAGHLLPVPLDLCLEGFGRGSLQRFIALERPHHLTGHAPGPAGPGAPPFAYGSLSELYAAIRAAVQTVDGVFLVDRGRGGGEHHLFMRETLNVTHPDYQLEVDDVSSAVFAIDFVTEHGEGNVIDAPLPSDSHYDTFLRVAEALAAEHAVGPGGRRVPWEPAYPVPRNPTLRPGHPGAELVTDPEARAAIDLFNRSYALTMRLMVQHFGLSPDKSLRRSRLMNAALDLMTGVLRPLGEHIVTLPSGRPGRTAGPSFEMGGDPVPIPRADVAARWIAARCAELADSAEKIPRLAESVPGMLRLFADQFTTMDPREL
ncbi:ferritin-like domain-containing protein [Streptomyces sp. NBC_01803]|uniref:ferritin-like domain-containing protein n=1 Tax=Streptomyces sp. NBC_01803 TaxID=2975946 RepID=UPI002DDC5CBF|nr:ferritin-like domain-containing protein [Streptomyces sp. NBC_01803]WSA42877.1 ferritin-like protein [Streptomyces sp. NBC_01803]